VNATSVDVVQLPTIIFMKATYFISAFNDLLVQIKIKFN